MKRYKLISDLTPDVPVIIGTLDECIEKQSEYGIASVFLTKIVESRMCECDSCKGYIGHNSDCGVHNEPAMRNTKCDCGVNAT